jgi:hypothetical protein
MEPFLKDFEELLSWRPDPQYYMNVIQKESRLEDRVTKRQLYVMLSSYTNNPLNPAITQDTHNLYCHMMNIKLNMIMLTPIMV